MLKSLSPRAMSLSTPIPSSPLRPTLIPLFEAIDTQTISNPSHQHITESITSTIVVSEPVQIAIPQTVEEATPLEFHEILEGISSGAAITNVESIDLHLDSSFISKTPLKATTAVATKVSTAVEGSPQNQDKGASANDDLESTPITKADTTTSGGNSGDPIKLGDELKFRELTMRMTSFENIIGEMKDMLKQVLEASKSQSNHQQICHTHVKGRSA
ncbi:hypothetical protein Hanom_Chr06g00547851 [Helianthus anomalus]